VRRRIRKKLLAPAVSPTLAARAALQHCTSSPARHHDSFQGTHRRVIDAVVDLNPIRSGLATTPEESAYTSGCNRIRSLLEISTKLTSKCCWIGRDGNFARTRAGRFRITWPQTGSTPSRKQTSQLCVPQRAWPTRALNSLPGPSRHRQANRSTSRVKRSRTITTVVPILSASDRLETQRLDAQVDCSYWRFLGCLCVRKARERRK
jgi:hypothetical protein